MSDAPVFNVDPEVFMLQPYEDLKRMREEAPIAFVPQLNSILMTRHEDIFANEKIEDVFSAAILNREMQKTCGHNMIMKDGEEHMRERNVLNPALTPKAMKTIYNEKFSEIVDKLIDEFVEFGEAELMQAFSMPLAAEVIVTLLGLKGVDRNEIQRICRGLIAGIANYLSDPEIQAAATECGNDLEKYINESRTDLEKTPDASVLSIMIAGGMSNEQITSNIKLIVAGGINEPFASIGGTLAATLSYPDQYAKVQSGEVGWREVFEEYCRWNSPIGMSPRLLTREYTVGDVTFEAGDEVSLVFRSGNRDEDVFENADILDVTRKNLRDSMTFGSGPHFCAGTWAARALAQIALPRVIERLPGLRLQEREEIQYEGYFFRAPSSLHVQWDIKK